MAADKDAELVSELPGTREPFMLDDRTVRAVPEENQVGMPLCSLTVQRALLALCWLVYV